MRSLVGVASFGVLMLLLFGVPQPTNAQEVAHNWDSNLETFAGDSIRWQEINNRYDCQYQNVTTISLNKPFTYLFKSIPVMINPVHSNVEDKCVVQNKNGKFTSEFIQTTHDTQIYSTHFGSNTSKMYGLYPVVSGNVWADPVQSSDLVLVLSRGPATKNYSVSIYKDFDSGFPAIWSNTLAWDFSKTSHSTILDKNGQEFKIDEHAFSPNGNYMVIRYGKTIAKVNLNNFELTPVAHEQAPIDNELAISNDGRYVAMLKGELRIVDTQNCSMSYDSGSWNGQYRLSSYPGCYISSNIALNLRNSGVLATGTVLRRPHFLPDNKTVVVLVGTKRTDINTTSTSPIAYDWKELQVTANNHIVQTSGYLAFGDSFSSGEGDLQGGDWYEPGTDEQGNKETFEGRNLCHLSRRSYPYLIAKELGYLGGGPNMPTTPEDSGPFHSVACSGAVIHNVIGGSVNGLIDYIANEAEFNKSDNQYSNNFLSDLVRWQPGRLKQLDTLDATVFGGYSLNEPQPEIITIGIGGNDAGFGDAIKACAMPGTCKKAVEGSDDASNIAIGIMRLKPKLIETYKSIRSSSPESRVYVHGYPIFVSDREGETADLVEGGTCRFNVRLDYNERRLVVAGVKYMNKVIQAAAQEAGVVYVDVEDILDGVNLCSGAKLSDYAVNGVTAGNDIDFKLCIFRTGCLGKEMFHPNPKAHVRYADRVMQDTLNFSKNMPEPSRATVPLPEPFFGNKALHEAITINSGGYTDIVIPEPKPFLNINNDYVKILQSGLLPGSTLRVELQSTPITIAEFTVPQSGLVEEFIDLPDDAEPGVHEVHLFGTTNMYEQVNYYEPVMIAVSDTDFDGDGILDQDDSCQTIPNSLVDADNDGIDDACDLEITILAEESLPEEDTEDVRDNQQEQDAFDDGFIKSQPNPETVAGNEPKSGVLSAVDENSNTAVIGADSELENAGTGIVSSILIGGLVVLLSTVLARLTRQD